MSDSQFRKQATITIQQAVPIESSNSPVVKKIGENVYIVTDGELAAQLNSLSDAAASDVYAMPDPIYSSYSRAEEGKVMIAEAIGGAIDSRKKQIQLVQEKLQAALHNDMSENSNSSKKEPEKPIFHSTDNPNIFNHPALNGFPGEPIRTNPTKIKESYWKPLKK